MKTATLPGFVQLSDQRNCELSVLQQLLEEEDISEDARTWASSLIAAIRMEYLTDSDPEHKP